MSFNRQLASCLHPTKPFSPNSDLINTGLPSARLAVGCEPEINKKYLVDYEPSRASGAELGPVTVAVVFGQADRISVYRFFSN